ncbi:unnamed protein product [Rotaria socialis]|uniref:Peptidase S9 prolyl oligopeptidase catalytic domain-containing protein n=1 Tax=Rotaria socialis TaxID=392032 RepID=A0A818I4I6_9BILA|nr:unnamed protein product [Rotaria socialis]CAF4473246.1 unnamed protein product [Rotaria socialis]
MIQRLLIFFPFVLCASSIPTKPTLTLDEFFNYVQIPSINLSPNGRNLLVHTRRSLWDSNSYENNLWLYETETYTKILITDKLSESFKPKWSPSGNQIVLLLNEKSNTNMRNETKHFSRSFKSQPKPEHHIYLYCIKSQRLIPIPIGSEMPSSITWANNDSSLYFAAIQSNPSNDHDHLNDGEWKDVIQHRQWKPSDGSTIYHIHIDRKTPLASTTMNIVKNVPFIISELLFSSSEQKLIFVSFKAVFATMDDYEIYSINLDNTLSLSRLTTNEAFELNLQMSHDGNHVMFLMSGLGSSKTSSVITQTRLYSLDLTNGQIQRLAKDFDGNIMEFATRPDGSVYILGQVGTNVQIYTQQSSEKYTILHHGLDGTYESISLSSSPHNNSTIAFVYSSYGQAKEVYIVDSLKQLKSAKVITNENRLFSERNLPQVKTFKWTSDEDDCTIEGLLHYPPGKFESTNLPLFVLIHGGPYAPSINQFQSSAGTWGPLAATEGWLVLEPNYRGSPGYGDQFLDEIRYEPLTRPGKDILSGVRRLIQDGIVDRNRLAVGGYSYGGFLTNWLITQTTNFKAALSGSGAVDYVSAWGTMEFPPLIDYLMGGFPWDRSDIYAKQSPIYQLDKVRTPTLIVTGEVDIRVPPGQSFMLERALHYLGVPVQLLIFPTEGHSLRNNPWHGKIKVREELKWLKKYGYQN